jgi:hypothetical protein
MSTAPLINLTKYGLPVELLDGDQGRTLSP